MLRPLLDLRKRPECRPLHLWRPLFRFLGQDLMRHDLSGAVIPMLLVVAGLFWLQDTRLDQLARVEQACRALAETHGAPRP
jgi:hypothetical protein